MKCLRCQHENPPQSRFCFECGARLAPTCSSCGVELPAGVKFCNQCGQAAAGQAPTGRPESAQYHLATAETMFRDMGMRSWLEKAQAEMDEGSR